VQWCESVMSAGIGRRSGKVKAEPKKKVAAVAAVAVVGKKKRVVRRRVIPVASLERIFRRSGNVCISNKAIDALCNVAVDKLRKVVATAVYMAVDDGRKTLLARDIDRAMAEYQIKMY